MQWNLAKKLHILQHKTINNYFLIFIFLLTAGTFLRFYNLDWGAPFYFHPDERNIAQAVSQLHFPSQLDPHFYAYGSLPIYAIYFSGVLVNIINAYITHTSLHTITTVLFEQAIIISRIFSALLSLFLILLMYRIGQQLGDQTTGLISAGITTFSTGFIQFAHFGTFEMSLTFLSLLLFYYCLAICNRGTMRSVLKSAVIVSVLIAIKVSSISLLPLPLIALVLYFVKQHSYSLKRKLLKGIGYFFLFLGLVSVLSLVLTPFLYINHQGFLSSMHYETGVALGTLPVFYTGEFYNTTPILFQFLHVYPFLLNPLLTIIFLVSFIILCAVLSKNRRADLLLLILFFLFLFLSQAFLFVKWTRYLVPTLPFMYLIIAGSTSHVTLRKNIRTLLITFLFGIGIVFSVSFTIAVYSHPFTTVGASRWADKHLDHKAKVISEVYDLGIIPFNSSFQSITLFDFYDLETNNFLDQDKTLSALLEQSRYIILPSQRIEKIRLTNLKKFPIGHRFYAELLNNTLGFQKIYETPCDVFCKIAYLGSPLYSFEETATVFDRPTLVIFEKKQEVNQEQYKKLL